jgi:hypothetical protein
MAGGERCSSVGSRWRPALLVMYAAVLSLAPADAAWADHPCGPAYTSRHLTPGADTALLGHTSNWIHAMGGGDVIYAGGGDDRICGDDGGDSIFGEGGDDYLDGGDGWHDDILGVGGHDIIYGRDGTDRIKGGNGDDAIRAGSGDDFVYDGNGRDELYGGPGYDVLVLCDDGLKEDTIEGFEETVRGPSGCESVAL